MSEPGRNHAANCSSTVLRVLPRLEAKTRLVFVAAVSAPRPHGSSLAVLARGSDAVEGRKGYLELLLASRPSPSVTRHRRKARIVCREQARSLRWTSVARRRQRGFVLPARARGCPELPGPAILVLGQVCCGVGEISLARSSWAVATAWGQLPRPGRGCRLPARGALTDHFGSPRPLREPNSGLTRPLPAQK